MLRIADLIIPEKDPLVPAQPQMTVRDALVQMASSRYSQLAVMCDSTIRIAKAVRLGSEVALHGTSALDGPISQFSDPVQKVPPNELLQGWYEKLLKEEYLVVEGDPQHIVTTWDLAAFLDRSSRDFSTVGEVEQALRAVVRVESGPWAITDEGREALEELTIRKLRTWILSDGCWPSVKHRFRDRGRLEKELIDLAEIRDQICHFKGELSPGQKVRLEEIHAWAVKASRSP